MRRRSSPWQPHGRACGRPLGTWQGCGGGYGSPMAWLWLPQKSVVPCVVPRMVPQPRLPARCHCLPACCHSPVAWLWRGAGRPGGCPVAGPAGRHWLATGTSPSPVEGRSLRGGGEAGHPRQPVTSRPACWSGYPLPSTGPASTTQGTRSALRGALPTEGAPAAQDHEASKIKAPARGDALTDRGDAALK